jgi:ABC-type Fe3+/spermidine/putrescine transport system ATPase subunit
MQVELRQLQRRLGITTIFVTHDQREALTMSDRVAVMHRGRIEQCASPEEIYARPTSAAVANFIGQTSQISATVIAEEHDRLLLRADGCGVTFAAPRRQPLPVESTVLVMIRPEHVAFSPGGIGGCPRSTEEGMLLLEGEIADDVFVGDRRLLHVATAAGQIIVGDRSKIGAGRLAPGTVGTVQCGLADMMVFAT